MATTTATVTVVEPSIRTSIDPYDSSKAPQYQHQHQQQNQRKKQQPVSSNEASIDVSQPAEVKDGAPSTSAETTPFKPTTRFWLIMLSISSIALCGAIEATIVVNALPTITAALGGGNLYLWVPNAFFLASVATLPLFAQASNTFGRRSLLLGAVALFILGCALGGANTSMKMLIVARTIQGVGSGGIDTLVETIILDLVPLRERSKYMSIVAAAATIGFVAGPFLGGLIVVRLGWQWVFYLNAIISGVTLVLFSFFLRLKHERGQTVRSKLKRIDFGGNAIFVGAVVAILLALTWAGPVYHWDSAQIIVPLAVGLFGLCAFTAFEWTPRLAP